MPIEANATAAAAAVSAPQRISSERPTEGVQGRGDQENASAAFSQRTNVSIETAIDRMADVLSKISGRQQTNVEQIPQELKEVIRNIIRQSFSIESTLAQGLGSTAASQRFSTDQLTTLARMLNQMGTMAETNEVPRVSDDVATLLAALKSAIAKDAGGTFEPIMLTKAAFQLIDTGNAELLPQDLQTVLSQRNASAGAPPTAASGGGTSSMTFLNQLVQLLMPRDAEAATQQTMPQPGGTQSPVQTGEAQATPQQGSAALSVEEGAAQMPATGQNVRMAAPAAGAMQNPAPAATAASDTAAATENLPTDSAAQGAKQGEASSAPSAKGTEAPALRQADTAAVGIGTKGNAAPSLSAAEAQRGQGTEMVQENAAQQGKTTVQQETPLPQGSAPVRQEGTGGTLNPARQPVGEESRTGTAEAAKQTPQSTEQVARSQAAARVCLTAEDAHVFHTNVLENLRVARGDVTPAEARQLLDQAGLGDWLEALPDGVETVVGTDAATLSGGERRRLLLARALAAPAPLMLLDEPGEHLDAATADRLVTDLLHAGDGADERRRGVLLVTHRLSALDGADEILVLDAPEPGRPATVVRRGSHSRLSVQDESYRWSLEQERR